MTHQACDLPGVAPGADDGSPEGGERLEVSLAGRTWFLEREGNLDALWEQLGQGDFGEDERIPYWTEVWPASLGLGHWLWEHQGLVAGKACLDMGCGLGLTALVGCVLGARVVGMDYEREALRHARRNAALNGVGNAAWVLTDWRRPGFRPGGFEAIWGSDVMYEQRFIAPVASFLETVLAPGGVAWLAEPGRALYADFVRHARGHGWSCEQAAKSEVKPLYSEHVRVTVTIWELRRQGETP